MRVMDLLHLIISLALFQVEVKKAQPKEVMLSIQGGRGKGRGFPGRGYSKHNKWFPIF